ncbi:MAG: 2-carboxy-1,4-naphthoquinone phytyltransferase [Cyanobacteria bacterium P01_D01_bin.105]
MAAIKPPMYCVAIMPICVGSVVAYLQTGSFHLATFLTFALSAILILVWENLSNDVFDATTGIDRNKHHSLVNLTRNRSLILWLANIALFAGISGIVGITLQQKDTAVLLLVLSCCVLGYLYQGPPFRLGYKGVGEFLCFLSFGPLAVGAAYYSQIQKTLPVVTHWQVWSWQAWHDTLWNWQVWSWQKPLLPAALTVGITTTLVLFCSHFHQVDDDLKAGKRSPIVRLGTKRGADVLVWACLSVFLVWAIAFIAGGFPLATLILLGSAPAAVKLCRHVLRFHAEPARVSNAKFLAIHFHVWSGLLLVSGLLLSAALLPGNSLLWLSQ